MEQQRFEISSCLPLFLSGLDSTLSIFSYVGVLSDMELLRLLIRLFIGVMFTKQKHVFHRGCTSHQRVYSVKLILLTCLRRASRRCATNAAFYIIAHTGTRPTSFKFLNNSGSRNLLTETSSARPFLLLVLSTKSRASDCAVAGSRGRSVTSLSSGSPGTMDQRSKTRDKETWPCVWICVIVSIFSYEI